MNTMSKAFEKAGITSVENTNEVFDKATDMISEAIKDIPIKELETAGEDTFIQELKTAFESLQYTEFEEADEEDIKNRHRVPMFENMEVGERKPAVLSIPFTNKVMRLVF